MGALIVSNFMGKRIVYGSAVLSYNTKGPIFISVQIADAARATPSYEQHYKICFVFLALLVHVVDVTIPALSEALEVCFNVPVFLVTVG